jgi:membrane peptidoglycan carboxypeptidase
MKKIKKFITILLILIIIILATVAGVVITKGYKMYKTAIAQISIEDKFSKIQNQENFVKLDEVPEIFTDAIVAVEDKRFYSHKGVDYLSILRAVKTNLINRELTEGGSTITQQIAKNLYFTQAKEFSRKIAEVFVALDIEKLYSKEEILEIYMNINFYGSGYYGIYEASYGYYEKAPIDLTDYEATLLAGVPNAPSVYSPKVNLNLAERRQDVVLEKMVESGYLTEKEMKLIQEKQLTK